MKRSLLILLFGLFAAMLSAQTLKVLTEEWAPFNYTDKDKPAGLAVEMIQAVLTEAGVKADIQFQPWNRAYQTALDEPNVLLFTAGRTPEREPLFNWLFRIAPREIWFLALSERSDIKITSIEQAKKFMTGVGNTTDSSTQELVKLGFQPKISLDLIEGEDTDTANIKKLFAKRVDMIAGNPISFAWSSKQLGMDYSKLRKVLLLSTSATGYWALLSKKSDAALSTKLQNAAVKLEKAGTFAAILKKYGM